MNRVIACPQQRHPTPDLSQTQHDALDGEPDLKAGYYNLLKMTGQRSGLEQPAALGLGARGPLGIEALPVIEGFLRPHPGS